MDLSSVFKYRLMFVNAAIEENRMEEKQKSHQVMTDNTSYVRYNSEMKAAIKEVEEMKKYPERSKTYQSVDKMMKDLLGDFI